MRRMSFALTTKQFLDGSKDVTRRLGWASLKTGDRVIAIEKGMGLKRGEKQKVIGVIEIISNVPTRLFHIGIYFIADCSREGFPEMYPNDFVKMFCKHMNVKPNHKVNRIEFKKVPFEIIDGVVTCK